MKSSKLEYYYMKDEKYIAKMLELINKIQNYCFGKQYNDFINNDMLIEACVFNLSQLGETAHKISDDIIKLHPEIAWNEIYGLRNRLIHDYEGTNPKLVWEIITEDLSPLKSQLENIF